MSQSQIEEIELNIEQAKRLIENGKALDRLYSNPDFRTVIREGYLEKEAVRLVHLKSDPQLQAQDMQHEIVKGIDAIGCLTHYFRNIEHQRMLAEKAIEECEETREELLAEGLE